MDFYLIDPAGGEFHFPVNPEEVQISREKQFETVNILRLGEVDFAQQEKVREIAFSSFLPKEYDPSYCQYSDLPDPQQAMNQLNDYLISKNPLRLLITETDVNVLVYVSSHNSSFRGGEPGDVYFDIVYRTWRGVSVRTVAEAAAVSSSGDQSSDSPRPDLKPQSTMYQVKSGDSLWSIAKRELGNGARWKELYETNKDVIGPDPSAIKPGQQLVLP